MKVITNTRKPQQVFKDINGLTNTSYNLHSFARVVHLAKAFTLPLQLIEENMSTSVKARFVVQKHAATHLHYDFRLEMDEVLKSWAVPKEPPTQAGIKRLAVQVEDHQVSYIDFEGTIPKGEYGAGKVEVWDKGAYTLKHRSQNKIVFTLQGEKLRGDYTLLRFKEDRNWLFFKNKENK